MRRIACIISLLLITAVPHGICQTARANVKTGSGSSYALTPSEKDAAKQAIVDEIYANSLQGYVADVGLKTSNSVYSLTVYFKPSLNADKEGWVIYKLMPYGQVLRMFTIRNDGIAVLFGNLRDHFPPTEPSYLTVYMNDDELCRNEKEWEKDFVEVHLIPTRDRVSAAHRRQRQRSLR